VVNLDLAAHNVMVAGTIAIAWSAATSLD